MAITVVHSAQGSGTSLTITSATANNVLVAFISQSTALTAPTLTGWTVYPTSTVYATTFTGWVATKLAAGGETSVAPTPGIGGTILGVGAYELNGASLDLDGGSNFPVVKNGSGTSLASTTFSTVDPGSVILCGLTLTGTSGTVTAWTSTVLTNIATASTTVICGSLIPGTTQTSITPTANWTTAHSCGMLSIALLPTADASGVGFFLFA